MHNVLQLSINIPINLCYLLDYISYCVCMNMFNLKGPWLRNAATLYLERIYRTIQIKRALKHIKTDERQYCTTFNMTM